MQDKEQIIIQATVSRTIEVNKQWYKFEYSEKRVVRKVNAKEERKKLWQQCVDEVEEQIESLKKDLRL